MKETGSNYDGFSYKISAEQSSVKPIVEIVGKHSTMLELFKNIDVISEVPNLSVTITGETGVGKELVALAVHYNHFGRGSFVPVNCSAIPESLFESLFFGSIKGAYTSSTNSIEGHVESANEGTLFMDEIGDLAWSLQPKLLKFLDNGEYRAIGDHKRRRSICRVISASNQDLGQKVDKGTFRGDLYHRLVRQQIYVAPLRERLEDIPLIMKYYIQIYNKLFSKSIEGISEKALEFLYAYDWPGNVRELQNFIGGVTLNKGGGLIGTEDVKRYLENVYHGKTDSETEIGKFPSKLSDYGLSSVLSQDDPEPLDLKALKKRAAGRVEKEAIQVALKATKWNRRKAAKILCVSYKTLLTAIAKHHIRET